MLVKKLVVAAALLAALPLTSANAAGGMPILIETSVDSGWTSNVQFVAARFDRALTPQATAVITDKDGDVVQGFAYRDHSDWRVIKWEADIFAGCELDPAHGPYSVTFTAPAYGNDAPQTATHTLGFRVDVTEPYTPKIASDDMTTAKLQSVIRNLGLPSHWLDPEGELLELTSLIVVRPGEAVAIEGTATDSIGPPPAYLTDWTSGVSEFELRLYNGLEDRARDILSFRQKILVCPRACAPTASFETSVELPQGVWIAKAVAIDAARNPSAASDGITIIVL